MYLVVEEAVEGEDEDTLQRVADGEEVHEDELSGVVADVDETQTPREAEKNDEHDRALDPRPTTPTRRR